MSTQFSEPANPYGTPIATAELVRPQKKLSWLVFLVLIAGINFGLNYSILRLHLPDPAIRAAVLAAFQELAIATALWLSWR